MASPRRSPRFKLSPKPKLPKKPRRPKRVKNPAEDSVRQANYQVELAAWEAAKVEHENKMQKRQAKQTAGWKAARKSAAEKDAPPPAAPQAALSPPALAERGQTADAGTSPMREPRHRLLRGDLTRWLLEVETVAARCGAGRASEVVFTHQRRFSGLWFDPTPSTEACLASSLTQPKPRLMRACVCWRAAQTSTDARVCVLARRLQIPVRSFGRCV